MNECFAQSLETLPAGVNGAYYDVNGNMIKSGDGGGRSAASHISTSEFNRSNMPKLR